ncbi:MAG: hypothetical protein ACE366_19405 [Bradymonadia bacterium]
MHPRWPWRRVLSTLGAVIAITTSGCQPVEDAITPDAERLDATPPSDMAPGRPDFFVAVDSDVPPRDDAADLPDADLPDAEMPDLEIPDADLPDAAPPSPVDVACPRAWIDLDDAAPRSCNGRRVHTLDPGFDVNSVAIARSENGKLVFGWDVTDFADSGNYLVRVVNADDLTRVVEHTIAPVSAFGELAGYRSALGVIRESFHLVTWNSSDFGGSISHREIRPDGVLTEASPIDDLVGRQGSLDMVIDPSGVIHVAWHDTATGQFKISTREEPGAPWSDPFEFDTDLDMEHGGDGAIAVDVDPDERLHVAYQLTLSRFGAAPRARSLLGDQWTLRQTLDNFANARVSGIGLDIVALEEERVGIYLDWLAGTGEIRLVRWRNGEAEPQVEILEPGLPLEEPPARYPMAMAADDEGLLHVVMLNVGGQGVNTLEYRRQVRIDGRVRWLTDVIDDDVESSGLAVDMVLDPALRVPHVIFYDPRNGFHAYATVEF